MLKKISEHLFNYTFKQNWTKQFW